MPRAAVAQMISTASVKENLHELHRLFVDARKKEVDLLVLPENFAFMGIHEMDKFKVAEQYGQGEIQQTVSDLAKRFGMWVIAGTILLKGPSKRVKASSMVFDNEGACVARYDKIHLFDVRVSEQEAHQESLLIEPGNELVVVETPIGHIGLTVCYDLRFPELFRALVLKGAEIVTVPSAFTDTTGVAHWHVLLRARAIENLCYVLAPNQGGKHENGRRTYGHSMVVEPWGQVIGELQRGTGIVAADIDLQRLQQMRRQFPCNDHHILKV